MIIYNRPLAAHLRVVIGENMKPKPLPKDRGTILLLCSIHNRYSQGGPVALPSTLQYVNSWYLFRCVQTAISSNNLTEEGNKLAKAWMEQKP